MDLFSHVSKKHAVCDATSIDKSKSKNNVSCFMKFKDTANVLYCCKFQNLFTVYCKSTWNNYIRVFIL